MDGMIGVGNSNDNKQPTASKGKRKAQKSNMDDSDNETDFNDDQQPTTANKGKRKAQKSSKDCQPSTSSSPSMKAFNK
jgi:hypothetical protein